MPPPLQPLDPVPGPGALERHFERVGSVEAAVEAVVDHAKVGRSVVWFRNTVDDAREAYDRLFAETRQRGTAGAAPIVPNAGNRNCGNLSWTRRSSEQSSGLPHCALLAKGERDLRHRRP
jgi:hypothetical protein